MSEATSGDGMVIGALCTARGGFRGGPHDLTVARGSALVLTGPNGSGKSTLLETVAGLAPAVSGTMRLGDRPWDALPPWRRDAAILLQGLGLWTNRTVREQAALAAGDAQGVADRIETLAERLALTALLDRRPGALSGGEAQRAALLRTLAPARTVLLLDEPTSAQHEDTAALVRDTIEAELAEGRLALVAAHGGWGGLPEHALGV